MTTERADPKRVVAVIPVLNEEARIRRVVEGACSRVDEVVVVDDGSTDASAVELAGLSCHLLRHPANRGKGESLRWGFRRALELGASAVISLDGDGQHPPEHIPELIAVHRATGQTLVVAARRDPGASAPRLRRGANRTADFFISWAAGTALHDTQSGFRLYPASLAHRLCSAPGEDFAFESEALMDAVEWGHPLRFVCIPAIYEDLGRASHYRPIRDTLAITKRVAVHLLRSGLSPTRLARSLRASPSS